MMTPKQEAYIAHLASKLGYDGSYGWTRAASDVLGKI